MVNGLDHYDKVITITKNFFILQPFLFFKIFVYKSIY